MGEQLVQGRLFDIQSHSVHDGPGCRTTLFFSGCPLRCSWCSNPEGMSSSTKLMYQESKCHFCWKCVDACPHGAIDENMKIDRNKCATCVDHACVASCLKEALSLSGFSFGIPELNKIIERDRPFWGDHGGLTFSGGEPLAQADFLSTILDFTHEKYIHTAIETSLHAPAEVVKRILPRIDFIFTDLKHIDASKHQQGTGVSNELILSNMRLLPSILPHQNLVIRIPIIPEFNNDDENLRESAKFIQQELKVHSVNLLPFHPLAASKYKKLGIPYDYGKKPMSFAKVSDEQKFHYLDFFRKEGLMVFWSDETPY